MALENVSFAAGQKEKAPKKPEYMPACKAGWVYSADREEYHKFYKIVEGTHYYNHSKDIIEYQSKFSGTHSKGATASGKLSGGWGPINAEVGYTANTTVTWTEEEAVKVKIRPGYQGWIDYGTGRDKWYGKYYYLTNTCGESFVSYITVYSPRTKEAHIHTEPF